jgi:tubulin polyglutamylase TTLL6/13
MCFQILGFDILIDKYFKPYLLEVNCSPSFATDSALDYKIKKNVVADAFNLLNFSQKRRERIILQRKQQMQERILTGKTSKMSTAEREAKR